MLMGESVCVQFQNTSRKCTVFFSEVCFGPCYFMDGQGDRVNGRGLGGTKGWVVIMYTDI